MSNILKLVGELPIKFPRHFNIRYIRCNIHGPSYTVYDINIPDTPLNPMRLDDRFSIYTVLVNFIVRNKQEITRKERRLNNRIIRHLKRIYVMMGGEVV